MSSQAGMATPPAKAKVLCLVPPSPPEMNVSRDFAGGYGTAGKSKRRDYGSDVGRYTFVPPSCLNTAAILEQGGFDVAVVDATLESLNIPKLVERIRRIAPDYLLSPVNLPSLDGDIELLRTVRSQCSLKRVVCYGIVCRREHERLLVEGGVDAALMGDPEVQAVPLFEAFAAGVDHRSQAGIAYLDAGNVVRNDGEPMIKDLNVLPFPAYHLIQPAEYEYGELSDRHGLAVLYTSKGCPFACGYYCPYPYSFGKKVIFQDPIRVVDDMERLVREFGITGFLFRDQVFTLKREHVETVCRELLRRDLDVGWVCETKYDRVDRELLDLMKRAGCRSIHYGLESGDEEIFWKIGKPGDKSPADAMEKFRRAIEDTQELGINAHTHTIIGLPGESWTSIRATINRLREWKVNSVQVAVITPYPGTKLYEEAEAKGWIKSRRYSEFGGFSPVMDLPGFSAKEMARARRRVRQYWKDPMAVRMKRFLGRFASRLIRPRKRAQSIPAGNR